MQMSSLLLIRELQVGWLRIILLGEVELAIGIKAGWVQTWPEGLDVGPITFIFLAVAFWAGLATSLWPSVPSKGQTSQSVIATRCPFRFSAIRQILACKDIVRF